MEETKVTHNSYFEAVKKACNGSTIEDNDDDSQQVSCDEKKTVQKFFEQLKSILPDHILDRNLISSYVIPFIILCVIFSQLFMFGRVQRDNKVMLSEVRLLRKEIQALNDHIASIHLRSPELQDECESRYLNPVTTAEQRTE